MSNSRTTVGSAAARGDQPERARGAGASALPWARTQGVLPVLFLAWMARLVSTSAGTAEGGSVQNIPTTATEALAEGTARPQPEVAPAPTESLPVERGLAGWFAYRDARTGELAVVPPELLERLAAESERERAGARAFVVERRLWNGAIEIDLPVELSSPLYGWLDEHGVLRTGHAPAPHLDPKDSRGAERRGGQ